MQKLVDIITTSRADFSIISPVAGAISKQFGLSCRLIFTGSHFSDNEVFNLNVLKDTIPFESITVPCNGIGKNNLASGVALSEMVKGFSELWSKKSPGIVVLLGDRYELLAPATAAVLFGIPIAHLFGGEVDISYCLDTQVRNALSKMAHIHFVSHEAMRRRLEEMGEESWRITVCGNPSIESVADDKSIFLNYAKNRGWKTDKLIAACYLPPTTDRVAAIRELESILAALAEYSDHTIIWTGVNADPGSVEIKKRIDEHCQLFPNSKFNPGLGQPIYHSFLACADVMIGNSSSGLLEAASFQLPVINVGMRQIGRLSGHNVINVSPNKRAIGEALKKALYDLSFRNKMLAEKNPFYRNGSAICIAKRIGNTLQREKPMKLLLKKAVSADPISYMGLQRVQEINSGSYFS